MKKYLFLFLLFPLLAFSAGVDEARSVALDHLNVESVTLDQETPFTYFFITDLEYSPDDIAEDFPCFRGVAVDKASLQVVDPSKDEGIDYWYAYSDIWIEGNTVISCAD